MKKLLAILTAMMMLVMTFAMAETSETTTNADLDTMTGAWASWTGDPTEIPDEVRASFDKAIEGLLGCTYEPVALLGTQLVSGTNYCLLCKTTVVMPDAPVSYTLVYIYQPLDGDAQLLQIEVLVLDASEV